MKKNVFIEGLKSMGGLGREVMHHNTDVTMEAIRNEGLPVFFGKCSSGEVDDHLNDIYYNVFMVAYKANKEERFKNKQEDYLTKFEDLLDIALNDLGVVIFEMTSEAKPNSIEKFLEVTRLLKEIREKLKGEGK